MKQGRRGAAATCLLAALLVGACRQAPSDEHVAREPVTLEPIEGTQFSRMTLTAGAAERLDIKTSPVADRGRWTVVPSGALIVDPNGDFWVYTNPQPLVFVRHEIDIDREDGDEAFLLSGPPVGTEVVTVGAAELYGAEFGVGH